MIWVLLAALAGGVSVLFQAQSARAEDHDGGLGLLASLVRRPRYLVGMVCAGLGFVFGALALRDLPLFAVQTGRASSLAVTAVLAVFVLRARLSARDMVAVAGVGIGLVGVALASQPAPGSVGLAGPWRWSPLVASVLLLIVGQQLVRGRSAHAGPWLGVLSGCAYSVVGLCVRGIAGAPTFDMGRLVADPLLWAVPIAGYAGLHLAAVGLTRASLVSVTSAIVATETIVAALLGITLAGDATRPGLLWVAVGGFVLVLVGATSLARFGGQLESG